MSRRPFEKPADSPADSTGDQPKRPREIGGPKGPEPTRYGDWEVGGRCTDF
ncbi:MAG TPA: succinate dehydrogenase assembly factor 4 [Stellaceae bacterium]